MPAAVVNDTGIDDRSCDGRFRVTLLGTGTPAPRIERFGAATLVQAGGETLLFDAGRGVTMRLWQLKIPLSRVDCLFLTHHHSDHTIGIPDLWLTGWLAPVWGGRSVPFRVTGPKGTKRLMAGLEEAYALDIKIRCEDEKLPLDGIRTDVSEFESDGVVYERNGVRVIAFEVDHGDVIKPAYGYRVEYNGRAVVLSGDTRYHPNVVKHGMGADLVIHEVGSARPELLQTQPQLRRIFAHHTSPQEAGKVFSQTRPKLAAFTHLVLLGNETIPPPTLQELVAETRRTYDGPLVMGEDLMAFEIGDEVRVDPRAP